MLHCYHLKKKRIAERVMKAAITEPPLFHEQQEDQRSRPHPSLPPKYPPPLAEEQLWILPRACSFHFHGRLRGRLTRDCREVRCPVESTQSLQLAPKQMMPASLGEEAQGHAEEPWKGGRSSGWNRQVTTEHNGYSVGAPPTLILPSSALVGAHRVLSSKR